MDEPKPLASLGPTLLARKGGAKPAMRPQLGGVMAMGGGAAAQALAADLEDLGWNDMGEEDVATDRSAEVLQLTPAPSSPAAKARAETRAAAKPAKGSARRPVKTMHEELAERMAREADSAAPSADVQPIPLRKREAVDKPATQAGPAPRKPVVAAEIDDIVAPPAASRTRRGERDTRRAAFTLRLDAKRHLKLRLASTVRNRSAQQLVTEALDRFLGDIPEIELLVRQVRLD